MASIHTEQIDLDAYFLRIGLAVREALALHFSPTLDTLQRVLFAHACAIPFENIDVLLDRGIALDMASVQRKLVTNRRGGYCFEHNSLLLAVLRAIGFDASPMAARVRFQQPRETITPRTHLFVRVMLDGVPWIGDMGVGGLTPTGPIRMDIDAPQTTAHDVRRVIRGAGADSHRTFHQVLLNDEWTDVCEFGGEAMHPIDREVGNWWTSTNPNSKFSQNIIAARADRDGTRHAIQNREYVYRRGSDVLFTRQITSSKEACELLGDVFGINIPHDTVFGVHGL